MAIINKTGFNKLNYEDKKKMIASLFMDLKTKDTKFEDSIFLLQNTNTIQEKTLNEIYNTILDLITKGREVDFKKNQELKEKLNKIDEMTLEQDFQDADQLIK